jgi:hypothetical protein
VNAHHRERRARARVRSAPVEAVSVGWGLRGGLGGADDFAASTVLKSPARSEGFVRVFVGVNGIHIT